MGEAIALEIRSFPSLTHARFGFVGLSELEHTKKNSLDESYLNAVTLVTVQRDSIHAELLLEGVNPAVS